jgi:hypothetical protein
MYGILEGKSLAGDQTPSEGRRGSRPYDGSGMAQAACHSGDSYAEASGSTAAEIGRADGVQRHHGERRKANFQPRPVYVRFRDEDRLLLDARAAARGMRPATYVSVLTRSHLRSLTPLPKEEFLALKRSIGELASIGRNINQIARAMNEGGKAPGSARDEFRAMLKICEALRENTKVLLKANEISWATGHVQTDF